MKIDYISDIHIDSYLGEIENKIKFLTSFERFQQIIFPVRYELGKVLILSGDISHNINQIAWIIEYYTDLYDYVLYTHGNHEMYSLNGEQSFYEKLSVLKELINQIDNAYYLDGEILDIDNIKIGGLPMWYDFSYMIKHFNYTEEEALISWVQYMRDSRYIKDGKHESVIDINNGSQKIFFDNKKYFEEQKGKLFKMTECDVIFTHVMPFIPNNYPKKYIEAPSSGFFLFDSEEFIKQSKVKHWVCGHTHEKINSKKFGVRLYANPYGYPGENFDKTMRQFEV